MAQNILLVLVERAPSDSWIKQQGTSKETITCFKSQCKFFILKVEQLKKLHFIHLEYYTDISTTIFEKSISSF